MVLYHLNVYDELPLLLLLLCIVPVFYFIPRIMRSKAGSFIKSSMLPMAEWKIPYLKLGRIVVMVVMAIAFLIGASKVINDYSVLNSAYQEGSYSVVAGSVENFEHRPRLAKGGMERFAINGVLFEYAKGLMLVGYNKEFYDGGVIRENGQKLEIYYVPYHGVNRIIRIVALDE